MTLHENIKNQIKEALRAKDTLRLDTLRGLNALFINEILMQKSSTIGEFLPDDKAIALIKRSVKQRQDSIRQFEIGKRPDLAQKEKAERINKLPKIFDSILPEFYFERSDADYRPAYSRSIQGPHLSLNKKNDRGYYWSIDDFVTRDGKRKIKDFTKTYGEFLKNKNPKEVLEALIIQQEEIKNMIKNA